MIAKTALRESINEVAEEHEIDDKDFIDDLFDRLVQDFGEEIYDDEDEDEEEDGHGLLGDGNDDEE